MSLALPPCSVLQISMNSVERICEYTALAPEAPAVVEGRRPLPEWPQQVRTVYFDQFTVCFVKEVNTP